MYCDGPLKRSGCASLFFVFNKTQASRFCRQDRYFAISRVGSAMQGLYNPGFRPDAFGRGHADSFHRLFWSHGFKTTFAAG